MKLSRAVREPALAGIRNQFPEASEQEPRVRLTARLSGHAAAMRLFGGGASRKVRLMKVLLDTNVLLDVL